MRLCVFFGEIWKRACVVSLDCCICVYTFSRLSVSVCAKRRVYACVRLLVSLKPLCLRAVCLRAFDCVCMSTCVPEC